MGNVILYIEEGGYMQYAYIHVYIQNIQCAVFILDNDG